MSKAKPDIPDSILEIYDQMAIEVCGVPRKGAKMPYTSLNGHMFSFMTADGLSLRLPKAQREQLMDDEKLALSVQHGRTMKEYIEFPHAWLTDKTAEVQTYFEASFAYVKSLKPKPTKRK